MSNTTLIRSELYHRILVDVLAKDGTVCKKYQRKLLSSHTTRNVDAVLTRLRRLALKDDNVRDGLVNWLGSADMVWTAYGPEGILAAPRDYTIKVEGELPYVYDTMMRMGVQGFELLGHVKTKNGYTRQWVAYMLENWADEHIGEDLRAVIWRWIRTNIRAKAERLEGHRHYGMNNAADRLQRLHERHAVIDESLIKGLHDSLSGWGWRPAEVRARCAKRPTWRALTQHDRSLMSVIELASVDSLEYAMIEAERIRARSGVSLSEFITRRCTFAALSGGYHSLNEV